MVMSQLNCDSLKLIVPYMSVHKVLQVCPFAVAREQRQLLERCAMTSLSSKLVAGYKEFFAKMVVDAVSILDKEMPLQMIGIKKIKGGALTDSKLVAGVAFKKTFSYAGFEMQPKTYSNPKIALLNIELELKAERTNAEIRVDTVEVRNDIRRCFYSPVM